MKKAHSSSLSKLISAFGIHRHQFLWAVTLLMLFGLSATAFYSGSSASSSSERATKKNATESSEAAPIRASGLGAILRAAPTPTPPATTVETFASGCSTPQSVFSRGDTVCAKVSGGAIGWRVIWSNSSFVAVQTSTLTAANQNVNFTLSPTASLGDWRVIVFDAIGGNVHAVTTFTVSAATATHQDVDVQVAKGQVSSNTAAGAQVVFAVQVTNAGPDAATNVTVTDVVPANTTFKLFDQLSGPLFSCTNPADEATGTTVCTIPSLARGEVASFLATYKVDTGVSSGSLISNTATVTVTPPSGVTITDTNPDNDSSTASVPVASAPCVLTGPDNITVPADAGQAGAVVTYATPTTSGDCGQPSTGENGETIPVVSCNPVSGSFFTAGTTTVICASQSGSVFSFQVTVDNPGGLSISLSGASTLTIECGQRFTDPSATAVNASGQSVPVTITNPSGFDPDAPAVGSYTVTYTATEDPNSVSTTRTINVTDTEAPSIAVEGANPYRIITGSCLPFVDPGATAFDGCAGAKPVTTSVSGPGGATAVNNSVAGTYTVTYTATDGTHQATATRTVLVGSFSEDESDQPDIGNTPPTITLSGDDQITIECGTAFTDPGATAAVCGGPVPVTTSGTVDIHTPGNYTITYTATANSLTATATRTVTVSPDNSAPTIQVLGANPMTVECHTSFTDPGATAHDACAGDFAATASGTVDPNTVGTYVITYNATDPSGFAAAPVTRTVNVVDTTAPVVTAPANVTAYTGGGATSCGATVSDATLGTASASDSCAGSLSVTRTGVPAGNVFPVGTTTVTYSATDPSNNTGTATQTVTVLDNTPPVISCPSNITLESTCPSGAIATYTAPVGTDNCAGATTTRTAGGASGSVFPIGTTTVTHTVTDASGNSASCSFTVTVLTPQAVLGNLISQVNASSLTGTQKNGLLAKLNAALSAINSGQTNVACNKLSDFVNSVQTLISHGDLTAAQGNAWILSANHVRNTIGCTNDPCT
jgi:uncharacterized repeat protein (TIGR01451 family)